ncbi:MAG: hypothetical protein SFU53_03480 [Terrimicrobiaceae bacterium]|nr:hypothetical protein [Terrimicrobiaceae bacterium]
MLNEILSRFRRRRRTVIHLGSASGSRGCVVISYLTWPFVEGWNSPKMRGHTNAYEVVQMAESFLEQGFRVEVCEWNDTDYQPPGDCRIAIDIHGNLERWTLPDGCLRILHATGPHWMQWNHAELSRLSRVRDLHGRALRPRRPVEPSRGVEVADEVTVLGNEFTASTFAFGGKPVTRIPISSAYEFEFPADRVWSEAKRRFLWAGSYGMVHKGLDLALDAFVGMPELSLTVCGRPEKEPDFFEVYSRHLKETPNIRLHGWIDMASPEFIEIARTHAGVIYPSGAEGGAGSVIHCMHAGMIPLCTREASIDLEDFGVFVAEAGVGAVQAACRALAALSDEEVELRARAAYAHVRRVHTRDEFARNYRLFAARLIERLG